MKRVPVGSKGRIVSQIRVLETATATLPLEPAGMILVWDITEFFSTSENRR